VGKAAGRERVRGVPTIRREDIRFKKWWARRRCAFADDDAPQGCQRRMKKPLPG
jgi:hypothetical protein